MVGKIACGAGNGPARSETSRRRLGSAEAVAQSVVAKFVIIGINAATGIITARALMPAGRGELAAMILWPVFLANISTLGFPSALTFQLRKTPEEDSSLMGTAFLLAVATSAIAMILGMVFMRSWIPQYSPKTILFAEIFVLCTPLSSLMNVGRAAFITRDDFSIANGLLVWSPALTLAALVVLLLRHSLTPFTAAIAYVPVGVVPVGWMMWRLRKIYRPTLESFRHSAKSLLSYGIRSYGIDLCGTMALYVDQAVVVRFLAPKMMGIYVVALSLSRMLNAFHTSVIMVLFPKAVNQSPEIVREMTGRAARMSTLLTAVAALGIGCLGPEVLSLLYGPEYRDAAVLLRILVVEVVISGATLVLGQAFMALERPGIVTVLQVIGLVAVVPLMILLVPWIGIVGAGVALLISTTLRFIFIVACFPLLLKTRMPRLVPGWRDVTFMAKAVSDALPAFPRKAELAEEGD
jgi:O-antigen/teichoic acid export membrane protein